MMSSCGEYIRMRDFWKDNAKSSEVEMAILARKLHGEIWGYLTAYNQWRMNGKENVIDGKSADSILVYLENYCQANPLTDLNSGLAKLVEELDGPLLIRGNKTFISLVECSFSGHGKYDVGEMFGEFELAIQEITENTDTSVVEGLTALVKAMRTHIESEFIKRRKDKSNCRPDSKYHRWFCYIDTAQNNVNSVTIADFDNLITGERGTLEESIRSIIRQPIAGLKTANDNLLDALRLVDYDYSNIDIRKRSSWDCDIWVTKPGGTMRWLNM